ncbi:MAG: RagB/SusD family nutrient uptake outer membrane protein [Muribaculaceae bacterium]|nr:RagB/SusD family nutrient uptake outer membrane protein [Muribaculaceae bacterium]
MKYLNKTIATVLAGAMLTACADLDVEPLGSTVTSDQKEEIASVDPGKLLASVTGIPAMLTAFGSLTGGSSSDYHWDIGYPALFLASDLRGMDMYSVNSGYNWYQSPMLWTDADQNSQFGYNPWGYNYDMIRACNAVLETALPAIDPEATDAATNESKFYAAQALAFRAMAYLYLVQSYQFTYDGSQDAEAVPIITEENQIEAAMNGCANSTVAEVYTQILSDLDKAATYMEGNPVTPASVVSLKPKRFFNLAAVYGLRARAKLVKTDWAGAVADADKAIATFNGAPLSLTDAAKPGFNSALASNWMLGIVVAETDRVVTTGICNFPSHMGSFSYGYATAVGAFKWINEILYSSIPATDVRKGWWLDEAGESSNLTAEQQAYVADCGASAGVQVKFAPYKDQVDIDVNASDIPLMRIEEMYLIKAEAEGMQSVATGVQTLTDFVSTYRDPAYVCTATTPEAFRDAVWKQRRIELWGEGFSYFDMLRLKKALDRRGGGWPAAAVYYVEPTDWAMVYCTPQSEVQTNKAMNGNYNHKCGTRPSPVAN